MSEQSPRVAIIGAGVSGLAMAVRLQRAGVSFTILEKAADIGGTWRDNTYPGLVCDVPASMMSYTFERRSSWRSLLVPGSDLQDYLQDVTDRYDLRRQIRFGAHVVEAQWTGRQWRLRCEDGSEHWCEVLIHATGFLHRPRMPDIPGLDAFAGQAFHSSDWDHGIDLADKRVGIIGSGSTGVQIVSTLAGATEQVTMFQRTPQWILPLVNPPLPALLRRAFDRWPLLSKLWTDLLERSFADVLLVPAVIRPSIQRRLIGWVARRYLATVKDPELRRRLTPPDQPLCKRPVFSGRFYKAIQRADVELVDVPIERGDPAGIVTRDGRLHELDVIVLATGFDAHAYMRPMRVVGVDGVTIDDVWRDGPHAYQTVAVPGFPNMFMLTGPHTPLLAASIAKSAELQANYIVQLIELLWRRDLVSVAPTNEANARWLDEIRAAMGSTVWGSDCHSWYMGPNGVAVMWPFTRKLWHQSLESPQLRDYETTAA